MTPLYSADVTSISRTLLDDLRARIDDGCILIGGWAVYESTGDRYEEQSRDVDVVFSTPEAFNTFRHEFMPAWDLRWAGTPRRPTNACRFQGGNGPKGIMVDVFFRRGSDACLKDFHTMGGPLWKDITCSAWLPPVEELVLDKLETVPKRDQHDRDLKRFKDAVDAWALVFFNTAEALPDELRAKVPRAVIARVVAKMPKIRDYSKEHGGLYAEELDDLESWLEG